VALQVTDRFVTIYTMHMQWNTNKSQVR